MRFIRIQLRRVQPPALERVLVGPAELLAIAEDYDVAPRPMAGFQNLIGGLHGGGPVDAAARRTEPRQGITRLVVIASLFTQHRNLLLLGVQHRDAIARREFREESSGPF